MNENFWKPQPREPWKDWRTYSMLIPILSGALGACIFFALGLAFAEVVNIRPEVRKPLVLTASFAVAFGSTFGSIGSGIEVFRKSYKGQATAWDWTSLIISILTTIVGMIMGFAALLGATQTWSQIATIYGCIVVGGFASLDTGGDMIELGGLFGSFEDRFEHWLAEREQWRQENGQGAASAGRQVAARVEQVAARVEQVAADAARLSNRWTWPTATKADFERIVSGMNGDRARLDRETLSAILAEHEMNMPADSTVRRWLS